MSEDLLPCPFCGSEAEHSFFDTPQLTKKITGCRKCRLWIDGHANSHDLQTITWNTRASQWRDIETAPRDGRCILLWWDSCKDPVTGRFSYDDETNTSGFMSDGDDVIPRNQNNCTHWQPLPQPPVSK